MSQGEAPEPPEPNFGFDDSRRLTGPSRFFADTATTLTPLGPIADDPAAHARWCERVRAMAAELGWPEPRCVVQRHAHGSLLLCSAPRDTLLTATEISEWAWEGVLEERGAIAGFDRAQALGAEAASVLAARAQAERRPALLALRAAAEARGLPVFDDDDELSIGAGAGSRCWPLAALPSPEAVPWAELHDVPTLLVTGSNGKTTTVRLLAAMAREAGFASGHCSTEGVVVAGQPLAQGDYSGPAGARTVLRDRRVTAAVLETARGGILRRGLAVRRADVAVVTNISGDHFGEYGIDTPADLAEVKLTLARAVASSGTLVLGGADAVLMQAAQRLPHARGARQALFAFDADHPRLVAWRAQGGATCGTRGAQLLLQRGGAEHSLGEVAAMPLTLNGTARHNVENAAAAALAAACAGWPLQAIRQALANFGAQPQDNPGRLERWPWRGATVLVDYAHNPDGLAQLLQVAQSLRAHPHSRLLLLLGQAGNRDDASIEALCRVAAAAGPSRIVIKELPGMLRGRAPGEVPALLRRSLLAAGVGAALLHDEADEALAARHLLDAASAGDVVVLPVHTASVRRELAGLLAAG